MNNGKWFTIGPNHVNGPPATYNPAPTITYLPPPTLDELEVTIIESTEVNKDGIYCRACNDFNRYAEVDSLTNDGKFTCWACAQHPERKFLGLPKAS